MEPALVVVPLAAPTALLPLPTSVPLPATSDPLAPLPAVRLLPLPVTGVVDPEASDMPVDAPALELAPLVDELPPWPLDAVLGEAPQAATANRGMSRKMSFVGRMVLFWGERFSVTAHNVCVRIRVTEKIPRSRYAPGRAIVMKLTMRKWRDVRKRVRA